MPSTEQKRLKDAFASSIVKKTDFEALDVAMVDRACWCLKLLLLLASVLELEFKSEAKAAKSSGPAQHCMSALLRGDLESLSKRV
jgi:hypothetical protein